MGDGLVGRFDHEPELLPIAAGSELLGRVHRHADKSFVTIKGPCGEGHTMSFDEARNLLRWVARNVPPDDVDMAANAAYTEQIEVKNSRIAQLERRCRDLMFERDRAEDQLSTMGVTAAAQSDDVNPVDSEPGPMGPL